MPTHLDNGQRSPRKLLRAVVARCSGGRANNGELLPARAGAVGAVPRLS